MENFKLSYEYCNKIIEVFNSPNLMETFISKDRSYKRFIIDDNSVNKTKYIWLWDSVDNLIKTNLGNDYYLSIWVIILKYDSGDYFSLHADKPDQNDARCLSGGVELSNRYDFIGGDYIIQNIPNDFDRGRLVTHKVNVLHEITPVTHGTRWSLHFGINKIKNIF